MRQWMVSSGAKDESALKLVDNVPVPEAGPGEILVKIHATSLNYRDHLVLHGTYYGTLDHDIVPLSDAAGVVEAVGEGVTKFKVGDRVASQYYQNWPSGPFPGEDKIGPPIGGPHQRGMLAEYAVLTEAGAMPIPDSLSFREAAALPCAGNTAWNALFGDAPVQAGQTVLVLGTGGVSMIALQMAKAVGARVIATSSRADKMAMAEALGADLVINYVDHPQWSEQVLAFTNGAGCDKIVEVGGDGTLEQSLASIGYGGEIALTGFLAAADRPPSAFMSMYKGARMRGVALGNGEMFADMIALYDRAGVKPAIGRVFGFEQTVEAYHHKASTDMFAKIVVDVV